MRYLYKTSEDELVDLSLDFPVPDLSPLSVIFHSVGIQYPNCWIGIRIQSDFVKNQLPFKLLKDIPCKYRIPGNFDIIGGPLIDGMPADYIVGFEMKRFRYIAGELKDPDSFGTSQAKGYTFFGFNKVMLCHILVADPVHHPDYNDWLLNSSIVAEGMTKLRKRRVGINEDVFCGCGYSILGWAQVSHKDPLDAGGLPTDIVKSAEENPFAKNIDFQNVRNALIAHVRELFELRVIEGKRSSSQPVIVSIDNSM